MQTILKILSIGLLMIATTTQASTMMFTATRVLEVSDRHAPVEKLLRAPIRMNSAQKTMLVPRTQSCVAEYCNEMLRYSKLQLVKFQKISGTMTQAKGKGKIMLENGENAAEVTIIGTNSRSAKMTITTVSSDGQYKSQAMLEGYITESAF